MAKFEIINPEDGEVLHTFEIKRSTGRVADFEIECEVEDYIKSTYAGDYESLEPESDDCIYVNTKDEQGNVKHWAISASITIDYNAGICGADDYKENL